MSKPFKSLKTSLGLFDFFSFGKYQNCRVDSIVEMDYNYISFLHKKGVKFDPKVLQAVETMVARSYEETPVEDQNFDDVPF